MPTYTFRCECEHEFDVYAKMSDSKGESIECPNCHEIGKLRQQIAPSKIVSGHATNFRIDDGFKDILKGIKKKYRNNTITAV